jgi:hypothetical protein
LEEAMLCAVWAFCICKECSMVEAKIVIIDVGSFPHLHGFVKHSKFQLWFVFH